MHITPVEWENTEMWLGEKNFCSVSAANINEIVKLEKSPLPKAKSIQPHRMPGRGMDRAIKRILFS